MSRTATHRPAVRRRRFRHDDLVAVDLFCVDEQTEILTTAGWKRYDELAVGDIALTIRPDGSAAEWQPVEAVNVFPAEPRKMQMIDGRGISALTTDNHRWLSNHRTTTSDGRAYRWRMVRSDELTCDDRIPMSAPVANLPTALTVPDALVELVAWYWTEGTDRACGRVHIVQDHTVNPQHVSAIRSALVEVFGPEREKRKRPDGPLWAENRWGTQTTFGLNRAAAAALRQAAPGKVPSVGWLTKLTQAQLDLFIQRSLDADGHERVRSSGRTERVLCQGDRERASAFQAACMVAGHAASMKRYESTYRHDGTVREFESWAVTIGMREFVKPLRQKRVEWVEHDGIVWCPTTPNGTWLARRNGTCYFTGNSGFGGLTKGIEVAGFTTIMAANHNTYKVEVHEANHPHAEHWIADLVDPESSDYHSARDLPPGDLLVAGVSCFAAGSLVLTRRGLVPIEDVNVGDEVWTHRARWRPVTHTSAVQRPTVTVNATTAITCTPDHPFIAAQATRAYQTRRKYQPLEGARCLECHGPVPQFKANTACLFCSRECSQADANRRALPVLGEPGEVRADSLAGHWVATPILRDDTGTLPVIEGLGPITEDVAWVIGRWIGDGWVSRRPERGDVWSRVTICASHEESDVLAKELEARTDLPWNRTRQRTTDTFHVNRVGLAAFLADQFGHGAAGKRLPSWLLFAPEPIHRAFVDGYLSADGHTSRDGLRVQSMSVSKQLSVGVRLLLTSLGYYATVHYQRPKATAVIEGRAVRQRPRWTVTAHLVQQRRPKHRDVDGYRWGKASGTVTPGETVTVYNMTVAEDHTYIVDGILVHNCVNHSQANTQKAYEQRMSLFDLEDPDFDARVTRSERDRATANCVLHYADQHHPRLILIECTTELTSWGPAIPGRSKVGDGTTYRWWLKQFDLLGYRHRVLYLNSMFFGVPQSRDRLYIAFWDRRLPTPDLDHRPEAWCGYCDQVVQSVWTWRTGVPPTGSVRYGKQYDYRCPSCRRPVIPPMTPSLDALDLTDLGTRIGERKRPLAAATMARAERCRQRFAEFPAVLMPAKAVHGSERHPWQPMATQTSQQETALLSTGALLAAAGNTYERPGSECRTRGFDQPLWSQTATNGTGLIAPPIAAATGSVIAAHRHNGDGQHIMRPMDTVTSTHEKAVLLAVNNYQGEPRSAGEPLPTQGGSETLGVLSSGVVPFRQNTIPTVHSESMPTVTSDQVPGLLTAAGTVQFRQGTDRRVAGVDQPLNTVVADGAGHGMLFSGWYKQNGSAGAETAPHPLSDPLGALTSRDTTAVLTAEWHAALAKIALDDCYFRMLGKHEIGRGCGFDVDFADHRGEFVVWGSARDQVDGFGNAVSPPVGTWIGSRLRAVLDTSVAA